MKNIKPEEVQKKLSNKEDISIIDVRTNEEVQKGIIPGANHIPLEELPDRINEVPKDKEHIMVCRSGNRSGKAAKHLEEKGFSTQNMTGGMMGWHGPTNPKL